MNESMKNKSTKQLYESMKNKSTKQLINQQEVPARCLPALLGSCVHAACACLSDFSASPMQPRRLWIAVLTVRVAWGIVSSSARCLSGINKLADHWRAYGLQFYNHTTVLGPQAQITVGQLLRSAKKKKPRSIRTRLSQRRGAEFTYGLASNLG